jgi:hypothetical protein
MRKAKQNEKPHLVLQRDFQRKPGQVHFRAVIQSHLKLAKMLSTS